MEQTFSIEHKQLALTHSSLYNSIIGLIGSVNRLQDIFHAVLLAGYWQKSSTRFYYIIY